MRQLTERQWKALDALARNGPQECARFDRRTTGSLMRAGYVVEVCARPPLYDITESGRQRWAFAT